MTALELRSTAQPPRLRGLPWIGPLGFLADTVGFLAAARERGDVQLMRVFGSPMFLVYAPELAEQLLIKNQKNYRKDRYVQRAVHVFGNGLLRAEGELWREQRRLIQPSFHRQRVRGYGETMLALSASALAPLAHGSELDFQTLMTALTLDIAVQTMFGQSSNMDAARVARLFNPLMARFDAIGYLLEPDWWPSPSQLRFKRALRALDEIVARYIAIRREAPGDDVLSTLLEMRDEAGAPMSAKQLRDEVMTLFIAGHETTALTLVFAWRLLALHPEVARALHAEIGALPELSVDDLPRLTLLDRVIKEALRLYPPAYVIPREAVGPDSLGGYDVPPGAQLLICVAAMHRDPRHFPEPDAFRPERWTKDFEAQLPRCAYFPFGGGPRMCVGAAFADLEAKLVLATLIRRFKPRVLSDAPLRMFASLTQRPRGGLPVRLEAWD